MPTDMKPQIAEKAQTVTETAEKYQRAAGVLFTEYRGLKVHQMQALRKELVAKGGELQVIKNTLFKRAIGEDAQKLTDDLSSGPTAIAFVYENETECAKVLVDFTKTNKSFVVKGGILDGNVYDAAGIDAISKLPPRDVLIAQVIGAIAAPLSNLVGVIEALYADPIRTIGAVADKVAEGSPVETKAEAPAPETVAEPEAEETQAEASERAPEAASEEPAPAEDAAATTEEPKEETE